jgi:hypothetical protein
VLFGVHGLAGKRGWAPGMNIPVVVLIVVGAAAVAALVSALVHRTAKEPLYADSGRGRSMITVTGTLFAVVLAFVIFAGFQTYDGARTGAQSEAAAVLDMARTAALFSPTARDQVRSDLVCYGRAVVSQEWPAMRHGQTSPVVEHWVGAYRGVVGQMDLSSPREQIGLQQFLDEAATRTAGRLQRIAEDTPAVPAPLWLALVFGGCMSVALQLAMADPRERATIQALMVAGLASVVAASLLVIYFLDHPYQQIGGIQPTAMRQTLVLMRGLEPGLRPACSQTGQPISVARSPGA